MFIISKLPPPRDIIGKDRPRHIYAVREHISVVKDIKASQMIVFLPLKRKKTNT